MPKTARRKAVTTAASTAMFAMIRGQQWAITESGWKSLIATARSLRAPRAAWWTGGSDEDETPYNVSVSDGIATIKVRGPLIAEDNWLWRWCGWSSYQSLAAAYDYALNDPATKHILFNFDTPGGAVTGVSELSNIFYVGRGQKPQSAFVPGMCCSAGFWLASAIGPISIADVGMAGSLGVMFSWLDASKYYQKIGLQERSIVSTQSPNKNADPNTRDGRAGLQTLADDLAEVFLNAVSTYRDVSREVIQRDYGQGSVMVGRRALDADLVDHVTTEAALIDSLLSAIQSPPSSFATQPIRGGRATIQSPEGNAMAKTPATPAAGDGSAPQGNAAASPSASPSGTPEPAAAKSKADDTKPVDDTETDGGDTPKDDDKGKETPAASTADLIRQAKAQERERVAKIRALGGPAELVQACVDDENCTPADAALKILEAQSKANEGKGASRLAALRTDDAGAHASATPGAAGEGTSPREAAKASVDRFYDLTQPGKGATSRAK